jgi:hypothetical protein
LGRRIRGPRRGICNCKEMIEIKIETNLTLEHVRTKEQGVFSHCEFKPLASLANATWRKKEVE